MPTTSSIGVAEQLQKGLIGVDDLLVVVHHDGLEGSIGKRAKALLALAQGGLAPLQLGDVDPQRRDPAVAQAIAAGREPAIVGEPLLEQTAIGRGMALERRRTQASRSSMSQNAPPSTDLRIKVS